MSSRAPAVIFARVSKRYYLGTRLPGPLRRLQIRRWRSGPNDDSFWALDDVSFSVSPGEVLGIIGANGAGKTTILKILAGVTRPTRGSVQLRGRVSALIELGAGFHPELTGRDNIYLNGAILGMRRRHIDRILDDIVSFAELEPFIDTPVKRYSSGMYARLGFSIAIHVEPDVLLVDEVLSVGDVAFQQKSLRRMLAFKDQAKAMVFVSHNLAAVQSICGRALWLDRGKIRSIGLAEEVIPAYQKGVTGTESKGGSPSDKGAPRLVDSSSARIRSVHIQNPSGTAVRTIHPGDPMSVVLDIENSGTPLEVTVALALYQRDGTKCAETTSTNASRAILLQPGSNTIRVDFETMPLVPGAYYMNAAISQAYLVQLHHVPHAASFEVHSLPSHVIVRGPVFLNGRWSTHETEAGKPHRGQVASA